MAPNPSLKVSRSSIVIRRSAGTVSARPRFEADEHSAVGQLGQELVYWVLQVERAPVHKLHRGHGDHRFGQRCDAKKRVATHSWSVAERRLAYDLEVGIAIAGHDRHEAGNHAFSTWATRDSCRRAVPSRDSPRVMT